MIDNLSLKAYGFCDKLIRSYYHRPLNEYFRQERFAGVLEEYEDTFVSTLMPSIKKSITEYKMLIEFIDACNEVLQEYRQNKEIKKYQEALQLKKSYIRAYNRITKEIERKMQKIIDERFPELVKLVHKYVISQTIPLDSVIREFENLVSDLMDDMRKAQQRYDFKGIRILNSEFNKKVYRFLYEKKSEILEVLEYEGYGDYGERRTDKILKE